MKYENGIRLPISNVQALGNYDSHHNLGTQKLWLWLEEEVEFHQSTATRFMRVAKECSNFAALQSLGSSKIFALLDLPSEDREDFISEPHEVNGESKTIDEMSTRELQQTIKAKKEAEKKAQELELHNKELENQLHIAQNKKPEVIEKIVEIESTNS